METKKYIERGPCWMLRKWFFWVRKWLFYYWVIRYFGSQHTCRYPYIAVLPGSTNSIFLYSLTFCTRSLCVLWPLPPWGTFSPNYYSPYKSSYDRHHSCCDSQRSGSKIRIQLVLRNTRSTISYIWSFYNCKIWSIRFFINSFPKYIFKFKLDFLSFFLYQPLLLSFHSFFYVIFLSFLLYFYYKLLGWYFLLDFLYYFNEILKFLPSYFYIYLHSLRTMSRGFDYLSFLLKELSQSIFWFIKLFFPCVNIDRE